MLGESIAMPKGRKKSACNYYGFIHAMIQFDEVLMAEA